VTKRLSTLDRDFVPPVCCFRRSVNYQIISLAVVHLFKLRCAWRVIDRLHFSLHCRTSLEKEETNGVENKWQLLFSRRKPGWVCGSQWNRLCSLVADACTKQNGLLVCRFLCFSLFFLRFFRCLSYELLFSFYLFSFRQLFCFPKTSWRKTKRSTRKRLSLMFEVLASRLCLSMPGVNTKGAWILTWQKLLFHCFPTAARIMIHELDVAWHISPKTACTVLLLDPIVDRGPGKIDHCCVSWGCVNCAFLFLKRCWGETNADQHEANASWTRQSLGRENMHFGFMFGTLASGEYSAWPVLC